MVAIGAGAGVDGASQLLGSMDAGIGVLGAGEPRTVRPGWLLPVAACRIEGGGIKTVERLVPVRRAHASPDRVLDGGRRGLPASRERRGPWRRGARAQLALLRNPAPHALDEHREFLHVLRPVRQALPRAVARGIAPCERRERDAADARRQQEVECIVGGAHGRALAEAVAEPLEVLADQAGKRQRRVEGAAEVRALHAEAGDLVGGLHHEVPAFAHVRRRAPQGSQRALQRGQGPVLCQRRRRRHEPRRQVRDHLARPDPVHLDLIGQHEPARASARRRAEHVHLRQARERHDPVAPLGAGEGGIHEAADVVEALVDRVVQRRTRRAARRRPPATRRARAGRPGPSDCADC